MKPIAAGRAGILPAVSGILPDTFERRIIFATSKDVRSVFRRIRNTAGRIPALPEPFCKFAPL